APTGDLPAGDRRRKRTDLLARMNTPNRAISDCELEDVGNCGASSEDALCSRSRAAAMRDENEIAAVVLDDRLVAESPSPLPISGAARGIFVFPDDHGRLQFHVLVIPVHHVAAAH